MSLETEAARLLRDAVTILDRIGWTQGLSYDPASRRADVLGALALSAGATRAQLLEDLTVEGFSFIVPAVQQAALLCAYDECDRILDRDPVEWSDELGRTYRQVRMLLLDAAARLEIRAA